MSKESYIKVYEVEVMFWSNHLGEGPMIDPKGAFIARCIQSGPSITPELAKQHAVKDAKEMRIASWMKVTTCRRRADIEVESERLLALMMKRMGTWNA